MANEAPKPYIDFDHVVKAFGEHVVLNDVSFDVLPGETAGINHRNEAFQEIQIEHESPFEKQLRIINIFNFQIS